MKKRILTVSLLLALAAILIIGATIAYFTDTTDTKTNTFTVGKVKIDLEEPKWEDVTATLMPGVSFDKDPTITVLADSQDAYVFLKLEMNKYVSLLNLMGVDAYKNEVGGLDGAYPGFGAFANKLASDKALREEVLERWFKGIEHTNWQVMNLTDITAAVSGAENQTNPTELSVILGYIGGSKGGVLSAND
ncbi:MAG: hypothetical protein GX763_02745 [Clostridiaceae bacterium]|nr:hypothetical protein [Clostridiaceae bacterium]